PNPIATPHVTCYTVGANFAVEKDHPAMSEHADQPLPGTLPGIPIGAPHHPQDTANWRAHWRAQHMPWRTEPEITPERQRFLQDRRAPAAAMTTVSTASASPCEDVSLNRADVEWLLATHENGRGPIEWADPAQHTREGLDLRGANLSGENLRGLPLARLRGGLGADEWRT